MDQKWRYVKAILDGEKFELQGFSIWDHSWIDTGEIAHVIDPHHHQAFTFSVYQIIHNNTTVTFAAGEFSNCVWGIFQPVI